MHLPVLNMKNSVFKDKIELSFIKIIKKLMKFIGRDIYLQNLCIILLILLINFTF